MRRGDAVTAQHRSTAILASYFDLIFAANRVPHPGETRLRERARAVCAHLPVAFEDRLTALLRAAGSVPPAAEVLDATHGLLYGLDELLAAQGLVKGQTAG